MSYFQQACLFTLKVKQTNTQHDISIKPHTY